MSRGADLNPPGYLATQDLKNRGWTPALIGRFLGEHDLTRPNGLKMGRRRLPPVKLYREQRVHEIEAQDAFLDAQARAADARERAEHARVNRQARRQAQLTEVAQQFTPVIIALPLRKGSTRKAREPHLRLVQQVQDSLQRDLGGLNDKETAQLRAMLLERLDQALSEVYGWYPAPGAALATRTAAPRTPKGKPAKPSDWRNWDWD